MIKKQLSFLFVLLLAFPLSAQKKQMSYEYQRAVEALTEHNDKKEAIDYFQKDLTKDPKNGYSWYWMAVVYYKNNQYGDALKYANNALKFIPSSDKAYSGILNSVLCDIYLNLKDTIKALERIDKAIKIDKQSESYRGKRAYIYLNKGDYSKAKKDFNAMLKNNEASAPAYVGLGRLNLYEGKRDAAIEKFSKAINLDAKYQSAYSWRALVYEQNNRYIDALSDHIAALYIGYSLFDYRGLRYISSIMFSETVARLKAIAAQDKSSYQWYSILGQLYEDNNQYESAIEAYEEARKADASHDGYFLSKISNCYVKLGNYVCAINNINEAIEDNSQVASYFVTLADIHYFMGDFTKSLNDFEKALNVTEDDTKYYIYHRRGWVKMHNNDMRGALADFNKSIALEKEYAYNYLCRGMMYNELGLSEEAKKDFQMVISLEQDTNDFSARPYAHFYLGQRSQAKQTSEIMLRNGGSYYDAACLYSLLNESTIALDYFEQALQNGYRNFEHVSHDHDLDNIRYTNRFKKLIEQYKSLPVVGDCGENIAKVDTVVYIPFTKKGNVCEVKCSVNGLPLNFIFDTGADNVCLSTSEASMMLKQGYLEASDIKGNNRFMAADGSINVGTVVNLRSIELGGLKIPDVSATIVNNENAPALLGQSVLRRLGSVEIDYEKKHIKLTGKIPVSVIYAEDETVNPDALNGAVELRNLLKRVQGDSKRTSKYQTTRDAVAYDCRDAIKETKFYKNYCKNGTSIHSGSIGKVSDYYKSALKLIKDYINGDIDELDFSSIIEQLSNY